MVVEGRHQLPTGGTGAGLKLGDVATQLLLDSLDSLCGDRFIPIQVIVDVPTLYRGIDADPKRGFQGPSVCRITKLAMSRLGAEGAGTANVVTFAAITVTRFSVNHSTTLDSANSKLFAA